MNSSITGTNNVKNSVCGSRRMCKSSLRATEKVRRRVIGHLSLVVGLGQLARAVSGDADEDVFQVGRRRADCYIRRRQVGQRVRFIDQGVDRLAEDRGFADGRALAEVREEL